MFQLKAPKPSSAVIPSNATNEMMTTADICADSASATPWMPR